MEGRKDGGAGGSARPTTSPGWPAGPRPILDHHGDPAGVRGLRHVPPTRRRRLRGARTRRGRRARRADSAASRGGWAISRPAPTTSSSRPRHGCRSTGSGPTCWSRPARSRLSPGARATCVATDRCPTCSSPGTARGWSRPSGTRAGPTWAARGPDRRPPARPIGQRPPRQPRRRALPPGLTTTNTFRTIGLRRVYDGPSPSTARAYSSTGSRRAVCQGQLRRVAQGRRAVDRPTEVVRPRSREVRRVPQALSRRAQGSERAAALDQLRALQKKGPVTVLTASKAVDISEAAVWSTSCAEAAPDRVSPGPATGLQVIHGLRNVV